MNAELARRNMIQNQIRPWEALDPEVLGSLSIVKREHVVPAAYRNLAFADLRYRCRAASIRWRPKLKRAFYRRRRLLFHALIRWKSAPAAVIWRLYSRSAPCRARCTRSKGAPCQRGCEKLLKQSRTQAHQPNLLSADQFPLFAARNRHRAGDSTLAVLIPLGNHKTLHAIRITGKCAVKT